MSDRHTTSEYSSATPLIKSLLEVVQCWANNRSKDPSTKVGACIYDQCTGGLFLGYNGFPSGFPDYKGVWDNRDPSGETLAKYDLVIHAEHNAVLKALRANVNMAQAILVCTNIPCPKCMRDVIASNGIRVVYYLTPTFNSFSDRDRTVVNLIAKTMNITLEQIKE